MGWDYDRATQKHEQNWWTSYSDLFTMLSIVFLMMYVITALRNSADNLTRVIENQKLIMEVEDLREQNRVYNQMRASQVEEMSKKEQETYQQLMGKLDLLKDEAATEKNRLRELAKENESKEMALNHYQQVVRNIINANIIQKANIKRKDERIQVADTEISSLQKEIREKEKIITKNNQSIEAIQAELKNRIKELSKKEKNSKRLATAIEELRAESAAKVANLEAENIAIDRQLKQTSTKLSSTEKGLQAATQGMQAAKAEAAQYKGYVDSLESEKEELARDLAKSKELLAAKRNLAKQISAALGKAGVEGEVDGKTGDVILTFGDEYFDTNKANLKPNMKKTLQKFIPHYAKTLFKNKKIADKIESVEIIGYSSPTYQGRFVDPQSLADSDRTAVDYNLDLSYRRAKSIFSHIFDRRHMQYSHQKELLPLVKVTGRSFLADQIKGRDLKNGISRDMFCKQYDCRKSQRVIIKFDLKE